MDVRPIHQLAYSSLFAIKGSMEVEKKRKRKNELPLDTDFSNINSFARALAGFNFSEYCDNY